MTSNGPINRPSSKLAARCNWALDERLPRLQPLEAGHRSSPPPKTSSITPAKALLAAVSRWRPAQQTEIRQCVHRGASQRGGPSPASSISVCSPMTINCSFSRTPFQSQRRKRQAAVRHARCRPTTGTSQAYRQISDVTADLAPNRKLRALSAGGHNDWRMPVSISLPLNSRKRPNRAPRRIRRWPAVRLVHVGLGRYAWRCPPA